MRQWRAKFLFNGRNLETIVSANSYFDARAMIEGQYSNGKLLITSITEIK